MKIKIQDRQTGKSYDIAQLMKKDKNAICVQPTHMMKGYFCERFEISKDRVFVISQWLGMKQRFTKSNVYVDEMGLCWKVLLGEFKYATHTN